MAAFLSVYLTMFQLPLIIRLHIFQSNVRQTLACSLHEIAHVIGPEQTEADLIHPFNNFIYDIDSVKIGLLKNLSKFLQVSSSYCGISIAGMSIAVTITEILLLTLRWMKLLYCRRHFLISTRYGVDIAINLWSYRMCRRGTDRNSSSRWKKFKSVRTEKIGDTDKLLQGLKLGMILFKSKLMLCGVWDLE
jgi:hypothetical protein